MPRIRSVKPDYPKHRKARGVSRDARLLNIHLWGIADDEGRLRELPKWIIGEIFPDDDDVTPGVLMEWIGELAGVRSITRYEVDGERYIQIHDWEDHQKISHPTKSTLPPFQAKSESLPRDSGTAPESLSPDKEEEKEEEGNSSSAHAREADPVLAILCDVAFRRNLPDPEVPAVAEVAEHFCSLASEAEAKKFRHYWTEGPGGQRSLTDVAWGWRQWLERVRPDTGARPSQPKPKDRSAYARVEAAE